MKAYGKEYEVFQIVAEPTRFRVFKLLLETKQEICHCEFVDALGIPKYSLSKHVDTLVRAGLVNARKEGRWVYYSACSNIESLFCRALCETIVEAEGPIYEQALAQFQKRLKIRVKGKCVLGVQGKKQIKCY